MHRVLPGLKPEDPVSLKGKTPPTSPFFLFPFSLCTSPLISPFPHSFYLNKTLRLSSVCMTYLSLTSHELSPAAVWTHPPSKVPLTQNYYSLGLSIALNQLWGFGHGR